MDALHLYIFVWQVFNWEQCKRNGRTWRYQRTCCSAASIFCVCVWYTIPWAANHATICVSCRSVNSLQYKPSITSTSSPFPCGCGRNSYCTVFVCVFFWLITLISKIQHHQCLLVIWCELIMIMNIKLSPLCGCLKVCLRLPIETLAHNFDSDVFQVSIFLWVALYSLFWWCPRDSPE